MKFTDYSTGAVIHHTYSVTKYSGGVMSGQADQLASIDQCMEFSNDGFCDYCRITCDDGSVLKVRFTTPEQDACEPANPNFY